MLADRTLWDVDSWSILGGSPNREFSSSTEVHNAMVGSWLSLDGFTVGDGNYGIDEIPDLDTVRFHGNVSTGPLDVGNTYVVPTVNAFFLDTSTLGGSRFVERFVALEEGGEFRSVEYEFTQGGLNEDLDLHGFSVTLTRGADSLEN